MAGEASLARLVSLACHDLRTPLATVHGFARTLTRLDDLGEPTTRYLEMMSTASEQLGGLLDELALAARIENGRYEPNLQEADTLALAQAAADELERDVGVSGEGGTVRVDVPATEHALARLAECAIRHGGLDRVELTAEGAGLSLAPITESAGPIVLAEDLKDMGAAVARRLIEALGGSLELEGETLAIRLPS